MPSKLDEYLNNASPEDKVAIEEAKSVSNHSGIEAEEISNIDAAKNESYKEATGRDLDSNVGGYDKSAEPTNEISEEVGAEAKEAATGAKDSLANYPTREPQEQTVEQEQEIDR